MKAEIISIGTELLLGEVADTNATYLAGQLPIVGIDLHWVSMVGDDMERLVEAFRRALGRSDIVIATGGLGPTADDLTREAIAVALGEKLEVSQELVGEIRALFERMGRDMPPSNKKQATLIPSAQAIPNPRGTAPGWWVQKFGRTIVAMPGPPGEMQRMWQREVVPRLQGNLRGRVILSRTVKSFGLSEAEAGEIVGRVFTSSNPVLGVYAKPDGIHMRLIATAEKHEDAERLIRNGESKLRQVLGDHVWGVDDDVLEGVVGKLLIDRGLSVATMESCTGGLLAGTLTEVPGSSAYFKGGFVPYSNEAKVVLGVDARLIERHGAVSSRVAETMAEAARQRLKADIGIGTTGVAGPDELEGKAPGVVYIAVADRKETQSLEGHYPPRRADVKRRATVHALFLLRQRLIGW
jgi:nicotinamide-nucleotide amidase